MNEIPVVLADPIVSGSSAGAVHPNEDLILLRGSGSTSPVHVLYHELLHAISGTQLAGFSNLEESEKVENIKVGLQVENSLSWLNEAVTDDLTARFFAENKSETEYDLYIKVMNLLLSSGKHPIQEHSLTDAYFEYDAIEKFRKFSKAIREAYSAGFLVRLDRVMQDEFGAKYILWKVNQGEGFESIVESAFLDLKVGKDLA